MVHQIGLDISANAARWINKDHNTTVQRKQDGGKLSSAGTTAKATEAKTRVLKRIISSLSARLLQSSPKR